MLNHLLRGQLPHLIANNERLQFTLDCVEFIDEVVDIFLGYVKALTDCIRASDSAFFDVDHVRAE